MKKLLILPLLLILSGCISDSSVNNQEIKEESGEEINQQDINDNSEIVVKEFSITSKSLKDKFVVNKGDLVRLTVKGTDFQHCFSLPGFNIDQDINVGQEEIVEFKADKIGNFEFFCSHGYCSEGNLADEGGVIIIE